MKIKFNVRTKNGRSIGLVNFGSSYRVCESKYLWIESNEANINRLIESFDVESVKVKIEGIGNSCLFKTFFWKSSNTKEENDTLAKRLHEAKRDFHIA